MQLWNDVTLQWSSPVPPWLALCLIAALLAALAWATYLLLQRQLARKWIVWLGLLRLGCIGLAVLILFQPVLTVESTEQKRTELLVLVDRSASMSLPAAASSTSRWQQVEQWLSEGALAGHLSDHFQLHWMVFDGSAAPLGEPGLTSVRPDGAGTKLGASLEAAWRYRHALGRPAARVLLVSDGIDHGLTDPTTIARQLGARVDVLLPTQTAAPKVDTLEITDVQCARRVFLGSETHFRVTLRRQQAATADQKVSVRLLESQKPLFDQVLTMPAKATEETFQLVHRPEAAGLKTFGIQLLDAKGKPAATVERPLDVLDQHQEVLVLEDTWRWELKYLLRVLEDDPSFRFTALLSRRGGAFVQLGSPDRRVGLIGFPQSQADLERFNLFILGDVEPSRWPAGIPAALARQIQEEGKSLVVLAGPNLGSLVAQPEIEKLLPVEIDREAGKPVEGPVEVRQRAEAAASPLFHQLRAGEKLPPLDRVYPVVRKRAGATVLLEAVGPRNAFGNLILMAEQRVGRGRVLFVASDTLWKWHTLAPPGNGPTPYAIFWQQALRALAPLQGGPSDVQLWLSAQRSRIEAGQPVVIQAEVQSRRPLPADANLRAWTSTQAQQRGTVLFTAGASDPQRFRAEIAPRQPGPVQIVAQLLVGDKVAAESTLGLQVEQPQAETSDHTIDAIGLARLAQATGGQVVDPARSETWPQPEAQESGTIQRLRTFDFWNNATLLLLLTGLLAIDWFLRLRL